MGQRVLVTGSTGVLGRRVVPRLVEAGHAVTAVVRSEAKAAAARADGATPVEVDLFDRGAMRAALAGFDAVAHLATHIPTGPSALLRSGWRVNDSLRREASAVIAGAAADAGVGRMIQESITFPYVDRGDEWIDEECERQYYWGNDSVAAAEASAAAVTAAGGVGVVLRFAMFMAPDSAHTESTLSAATNGLFTIVGPIDGYISFIHIDDAAAAVVAALSAPAGAYNVAEPEPMRRSAHRDALAELVGRSKLRTIPAVVQRAGGDVVNSIARSHRISSQLLREVSLWTPTIHCIDRWKELR
ncbi:MAG: NAD-dependent epimerase/dehydratase family protein [Ilumatobacteraceae bacterium]